MTNSLRFGAFQSRYGSTANVLGTYGGNLDNGGETISIQNGFNQTLHSFTYSDAWYPETDGSGMGRVGGRATRPEAGISG